MKNNHVIWLILHNSSFVICVRVQIDHTIRHLTVLWVLLFLKVISYLDHFAVWWWQLLQEMLCWKRKNYLQLKVGESLNCLVRPATVFSIVEKLWQDVGKRSFELRQPDCWRDATWFWSECWLTSVWRIRVVLVFKHAAGCDGEAFKWLINGGGQKAVPPCIDGVTVFLINYGLRLHTD